jgi:DNA-binding MarR family transcriptional regulator
MPPEARLILEQFLPYRLNRAAETVSRRFAALYRSEYGLTRPEWRTLATIGQMGTTTATAIGQHSSMHKTKVSRAVFTLERRGWLSRRADPADRRSERLELTRLGRRKYEELVKLAMAFERELEQEIGRTAKTRLTDGLSAIERLASRP